MFVRSTVAAVALALGTSAALAQDCTGYGAASAFAQVESYFQSHPTEILNVQLQFNAVAGHAVLAPDGAWGPATSAKVCEMLLKYEAINGAAPDDLVRNAAEAGDFVQWMASWARFQLNPDSLEAPD